AALLVDRTVPAQTHLLLVVLVASWVVVTGALWGRGAPRWGPGRFVAAAPLLAAGVTLLFGTGVQVAMLLAAAAAALLAALLVVERRASSVVDRLEPVVAPVRRLAGANSRLLDRVGRPIGSVLGAAAMLPAAV